MLERNMSTASKSDKFQFIYNWKAETGHLCKYLCALSNPHKAVLRKQANRREEQ